MKKEYIKGYLIDEEEVGCEHYPVCYTCPFEKCKGEKNEPSEKRKQQVREAGRRYRAKNKDKQRERQRAWREKQRLAKLLDQMRQDVKNTEEISLKS